jgi:hypothetical protein
MQSRNGEQLLERERRLYPELKENFLGAELEAEDENLQVNNPLSDDANVRTIEMEHTVMRY